MAQESLRASTVLAAFFGFTLPLMPVQALLLKVSPSAARRFPNWYHKNVCRILGITLKIDGAIVADKPVLLVCNHTSWLDIPVLSALAPVLVRRQARSRQLAVRLRARSPATLRLHRPDAPPDHGRCRDRKS